MSCDKDSFKKRFIRINTKSLDSKTPQMKQRISKQYIPKYRNILKLQQKKVLQPSQDRLSELTTKQIDRLIQMQKIRSLLRNQKKGVKPIHINYDESVQVQNHHHPNVYQSNFIAKINKIALQRDIKHLRSQEFDQNHLTLQQKRLKGLKMQKKNLRFVKEYKIDSKRTKKNKERALKKLSFENSDDEKSIESINQSVREFEKNLQERKTLKRNIFETRYRYRKTNILSNTRWFDGMSTFYLEKPRQSTVPSNPEQTEFESKIYDYEHENPKQNNSFLLNFSKISTTMN